MTRVLAIPPQHGAWAFLAIPLVIGFLTLGVTPRAIAFAVAWIAAYPTSYYGTQALAARIRRGRWSVRAQAELRRALPWAAIAALAAIPVVIAQPRVVIAGAGLALIWLASTWLTSRGHERGIANDLLLVVMAASATPLLSWVMTGDVSPETWRIALVLLVFFTGSVLHVKALIREADDPRWHRASIAFHVLALAVALLSPWLLIAFVPALIRTIVMRPPLRPAIIGAVEIVVSLLLVVAVLLATRLS